MEFRISRREFLKLAGLGTALTVGVAGGKWAIKSQLFAHLDQAFESIATTCSGCPRACGIWVAAQPGTTTHIQPNPHHPLYREKACPQITSDLQMLYSPQRITGPLRKTTGDSRKFTPIDWAQAPETIQALFQDYQPREIGFLLGSFPDHLYDFMRAISRQLGGLHVLRYSWRDQWNGQVTLMDATQRVFGLRRQPYFETQQAQVVFSFGDPLEESPAPGCYWVHFGQQEPPTAHKVAEFFATTPDQMLPTLQALSQLVTTQTPEIQYPTTPEKEFQAAVEMAGIDRRDLLRLANLFSEATRKVALPGASLLSNRVGLAAAQAVLGLNVLAGDSALDGGVYLLPDLPLPISHDQARTTIASMGAFLERLRSGRIKALFVHGVDPLSELPDSYGVREALQMVERIISFSPVMDATSRLADYLFPDHVPLESWGYQKLSTGSDRPGLSAIQPAFPPQLNTRATVDLLLQALHKRGVGLSFRNELDFIRKQVAPLIDQGGSYSTEDQDAFWRAWRQTGGWWKSAPNLFPGVGTPTAKRRRMGFEPILPAENSEGLDLLLIAGDEPGLAPRISIAQALVHPDTASAFGLRPGQLARLSSAAGVRQVRLQVNKRLALGVVALAWKDGLELVGGAQNVSGDLAWSGIKVSLSAL